MLDAEMTDHLGYEKHAVQIDNLANVVGIGGVSCSHCCRQVFLIVRLELFAGGAVARIAGPAPWINHASLAPVSITT